VGFGVIESTTTDDKIVCVRQRVEKFGSKWDSTSVVIDLKKAHDSIMKEVYNILIEFGIYLKQIRLIKMCLNETYI
jgi:Mlc titration factor MtfA (ptsG expression regulator)